MNQHIELTKMDLRIRLAEIARFVRMCQKAGRIAFFEILTAMLTCWIVVWLAFDFHFRNLEMVIFAAVSTRWLMHIRAKQIKEESLAKYRQAIQEFRECAKHPDTNSVFQELAQKEEMFRRDLEYISF